MMSVKYYIYHAISRQLVTLIRTQMAKKEAVIKNMDSIETRPLESAESQMGPSPIRKLTDFNSPTATPSDKRVLQRAAPLEDQKESEYEYYSEESSEEESCESDPEIHPIAIHEDEVFEIEDSDHETVLSPKREVKPSPPEGPAQVEQGSSGVSEGNLPPADLEMIDDSQRPFESQVFQEVEVLVDSDEEQAKQTSGVFKARVGCSTAASILG